MFFYLKKIILSVSKTLELIVRQEGATPATIAIIDKKICVGLENDQLERIAKPGSKAIKATLRDLPNLLSQVFILKFC